MIFGKRSKKEKEKNKSPRVLISLKVKLALLVLCALVLAFLVSLGVSLVAHFILELEGNVEGDRMLGRTLAIAVDQDVATKLYEDAAAIYYATPEEDKADPLSSKYLSKYTNLKNEDYMYLKEQLTKIAGECDLKWIDLRIVDEENDRYVYIMDTEIRNDLSYALGSWNYSENEVTTYYMDDDLDDDLNINYALGSLYGNGNATISKASDGIVFCTLAPFFHPDTGEILGYIGIGEQMDIVISDLDTFIVMFRTLAIVLLAVVLVISVFLTSRLIVRPVKRLTKAARQYAADPDKLNSDPIFANVKIRSHDEIRVLADSMKEMETDLVSYMRNLTTLSAKQERMDAELNVAESIQTSMLPEELTGYEGKRDFDISSYIKPAREVGGDFYDYFAIDDDHIGLTIADVSGKGVPAALFMAICKTLLKSAAMEESSPAAIIEKTNRQLCENNPEMMFVTVWFGIYTVSTRSIVYVNAGHEYPVLYRASSGIYDLIVDEHDPVLGYMPEFEYTEHSIVLSEGDRLFLYTDGVPEATSTDDELYGTGRMLECFNSDTSRKGREVFSALCSDIDTFISGAEQFDDMTMLLLEVQVTQ